jgi:hypothetical protein
VADEKGLEREKNTADKEPVFVQTPSPIKKDWFNSNTNPKSI